MINSLRELGTASRTEGVNENCFEIIGNDLYDLTSLSDKERSISISTNENIVYHLCKNVEGYQGSVIYKKGDKTLRLAGDVNGEENNNNKVVVESINSNNTILNTVKLVLAQGEKCEYDPNKKYEVTVELTCDNDNEYTFKGINSKDPSQTCNFELKANSKYACGVKDKYYAGLFMNGIMSGIILLLGGLVLAIFGYKFLRFTIFLVCICGSGFLAFLLFLPVFESSNKILFYVLVSLFIILGFIIAFLLTRKFKYLSIYMSIIGGVCGALVGWILYLAFISLINTSYQKVLFYVIIILFCGLGVVCGIFFVRNTCVAGTSAIGAYGIMRGLSLFLESKIKYVDERQIFDCAKTGNYAKIGEIIHAEFYIYPALFIVFTVICSIIQFRINPKIDEVDDYKDLEDQFERSHLSIDKNFINSKGNDSENSDGLTPVIE